VSPSWKLHGRLFVHVARCNLGFEAGLGSCERIVPNYAVIIHEDPEGGFWGDSQGETVDELKQNVREAIAGVLEVLREQGREPDSSIQVLDVAV
jgi:predicted RNase H-like HicB family nuclease